MTLVGLLRQLGSQMTSEITLAMALRLLGLAGLAIGLHQLWRRAGRRAQEASAGTEAEPLLEEVQDSPKAAQQPGEPASPPLAAAGGGVPEGVLEQGDEDGLSAASGEAAGPAEPTAATAAPSGVAVAAAALAAAGAAAAAAVVPAGQAGSGEVVVEGGAGAGSSAAAGQPLAGTDFAAAGGQPGVGLTGEAPAAAPPEPASEPEGGTSAHAQPELPAGAPLPVPPLEQQQEQARAAEEGPGGPASASASGAPEAVQQGASGSNAAGAAGASEAAAGAVQAAAAEDAALDAAAGEEGALEAAAELAALELEAPGPSAAAPEKAGPGGGDGEAEADAGGAAGLATPARSAPAPGAAAAAGEGGSPTSPQPSPPAGEQSRDSDVSLADGLGELPLTGALPSQQAAQQAQRAQQLEQQQLVEQEEEEEEGESPGEEDTTFVMSPAGSASEAATASSVERAGSSGAEATSASVSAAGAGPVPVPAVGSAAAAAAAGAAAAAVATQQLPPGPAQQEVPGGSPPHSSEYLPAQPSAHQPARLSLSDWVPHRLSSEEIRMATSPESGAEPGPGSPPRPPLHLSAGGGAATSPRQGGVSAAAALGAAGAAAAGTGAGGGGSARVSLEFAPPLTLPRLALGGGGAAGAARRPPIPQQLASHTRKALLQEGMAPPGSSHHTLPQSNDQAQRALPLGAAGGAFGSGDLAAPGQQEPSLSPMLLPGQHGPAAGLAGAAEAGAPGGLSESDLTFFLAAMDHQQQAQQEQQQAWQQLAGGGATPPSRSPHASPRGGGRRDWGAGPRFDTFLAARPVATISLGPSHGEGEGGGGSDSPFSARAQQHSARSSGEPGGGGGGGPLAGQKQQQQAQQQEPTWADLGLGPGFQQHLQQYQQHMPQYQQPGDGGYHPHQQQQYQSYPGGAYQQQYQQQQYRQPPEFEWHAEERLSAAGRAGLGGDKRLRVGEYGATWSPRISHQDSYVPRLALRLVVIAGPCAEQSYTTEDDTTEVVIGRSPGNAMQLNDAEVSGRHLLIHWSSTEKCWQVADLGSLNGTLLNGEAISLARKRGRDYRLSSDDILQLGTYTKVKVSTFPREMLDPSDRHGSLPVGSLPKSLSVPKHRIPSFTSLHSPKINTTPTRKATVAAASDELRLECGIISKAGRDHVRKGQVCEDVACAACPLEGVPLDVLPPGTCPSLFCVFDGHCGRAAAEEANTLVPEEVAARLPGHSQELAQAQGVAALLRQAFLAADDRITAEEGCTATAVLAWRDAEGSVCLQAANVGDSAALFIDPATGSCSTLTEDHRLANPRERERLAALGIQVTPETRRLYGLNLARGLGDKFLKKEDLGLIAEPYVSPVLRVPPSEGGILLIASDGLWDFADASAVTQLALATDGEKDGNVIELADAVVGHALKQRTRDDVTVLVARIWPEVEWEVRSPMKNLDDGAAVSFVIG